MVIKRHLEKSWNRCSTGTPMDIGPGSPRMMPSPKPGGVVGLPDLGTRPRHQSFFDEIDWELPMRAVRRHPECPWVLLYLQRWLQAPVLPPPNGNLVDRERRTPQGAVVSPVLANLFLHYAFDCWMQREYPGIMFQALRYFRDLSLREAKRRRLSCIRRWRKDSRVPVTPAPAKTRIVYCKDTDRPGELPGAVVRLSRLHTFGRGGDWPRPEAFVSFIPAVSDKAAKRMRLECEGGECICVAILSWKRSPNGPVPPLPGGCATMAGSPPRGFAKTPDD